jgi:hypothetical protein
MRIRDLSFAFLMLVLTAATTYRYSSIESFRRGSADYSLVIKAEASDLPEIKSEIRGLTFQPVGDESVKDGFYRITFRCPPDKLGGVWKALSKFSDKKE